MYRICTSIVATLAVLWSCSVQAEEARSQGLSSPFYAMDTSFQRPGLSSGQQLDLVKELGYSGIAWSEQTPDQVKTTMDDLAKRDLKMFTIYCAASVTSEGELTHSPQLPNLMVVLKGRGTIIWLHLGGNGPSFEKLSGQDPLVAKLGSLADIAAANGLRIAIYPHMGEWTARFGDATRLAKVVNHPQFGVTFNLCHCLAVGDEARIPKLLEEAKDVLFTATINGADSGVAGGKWDRLIQPLNKGSFDVGAVLKKLKQLGFTGPIGFQGYGIQGDARAILAPTIDAWRKLSAAATKE